MPGIYNIKQTFVEFLQISLPPRKICPIYEDPFKIAGSFWAYAGYVYLARHYDGGKKSPQVIHIVDILQNCGILWCFASKYVENLQKMA